MDLDAQCNATTHAGKDVPDNESETTYGLISDKTPNIKKIIQPIGPNWSLVPAHIALAEIDIKLFSVMNREARLKRALESVRNDYDYVVIDCSPSLSITTVNALVAATHTVITIQTNWFAYEAIKRLMTIVSDVIDESNPELQTYALATMHRKNVNINEDVLKQIREDFGTLAFKTVIPYTATLAEASVARQPICDYADGSKAHNAYEDLMKELITRAETNVEAAQISNNA